MILEIRNFRGIAKADIDLSQIALVSGRNESGKSSIAHAAQAILTGDTVPIAGLKKSEAAMLIHAGTGNGSVALEREGGSARIAYPQAKKETEGDPPSASPIAAGMISPADMDRADLAAVLIDYLKAAPSEKDLREAVKAINVSDEGFARLWKSVTENSWDGAHKQAKEKGIEMKGAWRECAGEMYGSSKASTWMPPEWESDLEGASEESLQAVATEAGEIRDAAIAHTAISEEKIDQLKAKAANAEYLRTHILTITDILDDANKKVLDSAEELKNAPSPDEEQETTACPHCGKNCVIHAGALIKPPPVANSAENAKRRAIGEEAVRKHQIASQTLRSANLKKEQADRDLSEAEAAKAELDAIEAKADGGTADDAALERSRRDVHHAENRFKAFSTKTRADNLHKSIIRNQALVSILAPDGLRRTKLRNEVKRFNGHLADLAKAASWGALEITADLAVTYSGMGWRLCAESARYRGRAMLQLACAAIDGSDLVILDGADILDTVGRRGLFRLLRHFDKPALVCMTIPKRSDVPSLAAKSYGKSYWLENSNAEAL